MKGENKKWLFYSFDFSFIVVIDMLDNTKRSISTAGCNLVGGGGLI
jgi:hypothetical protein